MAEVEQPEEPQQLQPEAEVEAGAANGAAADPNADPEARYRFDEALLLKGKGGKVRRPAKPDEAERNLAVEKLKAEIEKRSARIKEIKDMQEQSRSARAAGQQGNQGIVRRLQNLRGEFQTVLRQKQHIREELQQAIKQKEDLRAASRQLKERLPKGVMADTVDAKIRELEHRQQHEGLTGEEEKALLKRISELNASKPQFRELAETEARLKAVEDRRVEIQHRLQQCDAVLTDVKAREEAERQELEQSRSSQAANDLDHPALNVEKKESWEIIQVLRAKIDEIRQEYNAKYTEYVRLDKNYNNYIRFTRRQEYEERQKARAARDAEENGTAEAEGGPAGPSGTSGGGADAPVAEAYAAEVLTLDQLLLLLRKSLPADATLVAQQEAKEVEVPKGMKLLKKEEDDAFLTVAKKKPQLGKKGGAASSSSAAAAEASSSKPAAPSEQAAARGKKLNHSLETIKTFMQFAIEVPQTTAELPGTIEKVVAKKEYYLELRRTGKKHVAPAPPAPAPATDGASSSAAAAAVEEPAAAEPVPATAAEAAKDEPAVAEEEAVAEESAAPAAAEEQASTSAAAEAEAAAAEPTVAVVVAAATAGDKEPKASKAAASSSGLGVALQVDSLTESVSVKLSVGSD